MVSIAVKNLNASLILSQCQHGNKFRNKNIKNKNTLYTHFVPVINIQISLLNHPLRYCFQTPQPIQYVYYYQQVKCAEQKQNQHTKWIWPRSGQEDFDQLLDDLPTAQRNNQVTTTYYTTGKYYKPNLYDSFMFLNSDCSNHTGCGGGNCSNKLRVTERRSRATYLPAYTRRQVLHGQTVLGPERWSIAGTIPGIASISNETEYTKDDFGVENDGENDKRQRDKHNTTRSMHTCWGALFILESVLQFLLMQRSASAHRLWVVCRTCFSFRENDHDLQRSAIKRLELTCRNVLLHRLDDRNDRTGHDRDAHRAHVLFRAPAQRLLFKQRKKEIKSDAKCMFVTSKHNQKKRRWMISSSKTPRIWRLRRGKSH